MDINIPSIYLQAKFWPETRLTTPYSFYGKVQPQIDPRQVKTKMTMGELRQLYFLNSIEWSSRKTLYENDTFMPIYSVNLSHYINYPWNYFCFHLSIYYLSIHLFINYWIYQSYQIYQSILNQVEWRSTSTWRRWATSSTWTPGSSSRTASGSPSTSTTSNTQRTYTKAVYFYLNYVNRYITNVNAIRICLQKQSLFLLFFLGNFRYFVLSISFLFIV